MLTSPSVLAPPLTHYTHMRAHSATSTDAGNYLSGVLLSLSMMLNLELPHVNVLSKCDMLPQYGSMERAPKEEGKEGGEDE